jgi:hypothetical protein
VVTNPRPSTVPAGGVDGRGHGGNLPAEAGWVFEPKFDGVDDG